MWAVGADGVPYTCAAAAWEAAPLPLGMTLTVLSAGGADMVLALVRQKGAVALLRWADGACTLSTVSPLPLTT